MLCQIDYALYVSATCLCCGKLFGGAIIARGFLQLFNVCRITAEDCAKRHWTKVPHALTLPIRNSTNCYSMRRCHWVSLRTIIRKLGASGKRLWTKGQWRFLEVRSYRSSAAWWTRLKPVEEGTARGQRLARELSEMRYLLLLTVAYFALGSPVARAQASNFGGTLSNEGKGIISETDLIHEFEYAWRNGKMVLEFSQYDCQFSVTEESIIPDAATRMALTMLFDGICDLEPSSTDPIKHAFPQEKIEEVLLSDHIGTTIFNFKDVP